MGRLKAWFVIAGVALGFGLGAASVGAQTLPAPQKASDFAREHGGSQYADVLDKKETGYIICGSLDKKCDRETEYCLKLSYSNKEALAKKISSFTLEEGKCVSKDKFNPTNIYQYFGNVPSACKGDRTFADWLVGIKCFVTNEKVSWLKKLSFSAYFKLVNVEKKYDFTDSNGKKYKLAVAGIPTVEYAEKNAIEGCEVLPVKVYNMQKCFFCPLASLIFGTANEVTAKSFAFFTHSFKIVLIVAFAIWVALLALRQLFSMTKQDAPKFLAAILKQGFKVLFALLLLSYASNLFSGFIIPVLKGGLTMGTHIQALDLPDPDFDKYHYSNPSIENAYYNYHAEGEKPLYEHIELFLASVQNQLSYLQAIGTTVFCVGSHRMWELEVTLTHFGEGFRMMCLGGILTVFALLLTFSFAFYFLDALLQLAILGAMLPFMIAGWPLKVTAQYATTGFKMLLNTFFVMFFTGFVVSVNIEMINQSLSLSQTQVDEKITTETEVVGNDAYQAEIENFKKSSAKTGFELIVESINNQSIDDLVKATDIGGTGFLLLAFASIFGFKFIAQTTPLANKLASGGFAKGGISAKIGTMAASTVKGVANKVSQPAGKAIANEYHKAGGVVGIVGDIGAEAGTAVKGIGSKVHEAGEKVSAAGKRMAAGGGAMGKIVGAGLVAAGETTKAAGKTAEAAGTATKFVGKKSAAFAKRVHQAVQQNKKK